MIRGCVKWLRDLLPRGQDPNFIGFPKYQERGAYHWIEAEQNEEYRGRIDWVLRLVRPEFTCLDLGCGDGAYMGRVAQVCKHVAGLDADATAIRWARQKLQEAGLRNWTAMHLPLSKVSTLTRRLRDPIDLVYSMDVFEHLPDPQELLRVAVQSCRAGGTVVLGTPLFVRADLVSKHHVREYEREELRQMLSEWLVNLTEEIQPMRKKDGVVYPEGYYLAAGTPRK